MTNFISAESRKIVRGSLTNLKWSIQNLPLVSPLADAEKSKPHTQNRRMGHPAIIMLEWLMHVKWKMAKWEIGGRTPVDL